MRLVQSAMKSSAVRTMMLHAMRRPVQLSLVPVRVRGRMFSVQESLPHLPVPGLQQTAEKFLLSMKPLLNEEDFRQAEKSLQKLVEPGGEGERLQNLLQQRAKEKINWLEEWWMENAYLGYRGSSVIDVSPGISYPSQTFGDKTAQLKYAAKVIKGALDYKVMIDERSLPVEQMGGKSLCMKQFYQILSSCRVPGRKMDSLITFRSDHPDPPHHIVVIHKNRFFAVNVYGTSGRPLSTRQIYEQLCHVIDRSTTHGPEVGILTAADRDTWDMVHSRMIQDPVNNATLNQLQRCIFILCLDQPTPPGVGSRDRASSGLMNHGWGSRCNSANRWFDKTLQYIVSQDGCVGLCYEHSTAEGPPVISMSDHTLTYVASVDEDERDEPGYNDPEELKFNLDSEVLEKITDVCGKLDKRIENLELETHTFDSFGKNFMKSHKLSPDAFIQICFQLTYYRIHGCNCPTYESGSLRRFQHGRTETIRSCTIPANNFCQAMADSGTSTQTKIMLFREAVGAHRKYTDEVINGQGIDRHLLGLRLTAAEHGLKVPNFFEQSAYKQSLQFRLSTSQVASQHNAVLCFGPVVPDGYGICYNPMPDKINFCISALKSCPSTDACKFKDELNASLHDARKLLLHSQKSKL